MAKVYAGFTATKANAALDALWALAQGKVPAIGDSIIAGTLTATGFVGNLIGNAATATVATSFLTPRSVNGVALDGTTDVNVPVSAGSLIGPTLSAAIKYSSLVAFGLGCSFIGGVTVTGNSQLNGNVSILGAAPVQFSISDGTRTGVWQGTGGSGAIPDGHFVQMTSAHGLAFAAANSVGKKIVIAYVDTGAAVFRSALEVATTNGFATLALMAAGGSVTMGGGLAVTGTLSCGAATITGNSQLNGNLAIVGGAPVQLSISDGTRTAVWQSTGGSGAIPSGLFMQPTTAHGLTFMASGTVGQKLVLAYTDTSVPVTRSALEVATTNGLATLDLMVAGGTVRIGGKALTFGAADSGGVGFRTVTIAN